MGPVGADAVEALSRDPRVERVGDRSFLQVEAPGFAELTPRQKLVAFHLARAAVQMDPVFYDQMSAYGLDLKRLFGALVESPGRLPKETRGAILDYAKHVFANGGNHNEVTSRKFLPSFTFEDLARAAEQARIRGARLKARVSLDALLQRMRRAIFDPSFQPTITEKNPPPGQDLLTASSNNYYGGVTVLDLSRFAEKHPLNSRLARRGGQIVEEVYRAGTPDGKVPPGLHARELRAVNRELEKALPFCESEQAGVIRALIRFYETGHPNEWRDFNVLWVRDRSAVDFVSGFVEVYRDARGAKGSAQMLVAVPDRRFDSLMSRIAENAAYFEAKAPWDDRYKKPYVTSPVARAVETVVETGDSRLRTTGQCLPGEQDFREKHGTKSLVLTSSIGALNAASGAKVAAAFSSDPIERELFEKYGVVADNLHTAMHEILGHGSGRVVVPNDPSTYLREYFSTLEEARADLVAYWNIFDPKLSELGVDDALEVAREIYRQLARAGLTTLKNYPEGETATEDHDRSRLLIVNCLVEQGAFEQIFRGGHAWIVVKDYETARAAVGRLLAEIMRIKAEGDYEAAKSIVQKYGIRFDPGIRDDVFVRYRAMALEPYATGISPDLTLVTDKSGKVADVSISYPRDFLKQQIEFARSNGTLGF